MAANLNADAKSAAHAAKEAAEELVDVAGEWIAPLAGLGIGWILGIKTGGVMAVSNFIGGIINPKNNSAMYPLENAMGGLVVFAIEAGVGFALLAMKTKGKVGKLVLRFFGGLGIGMGLSNLLSGLNNASSGMGLFDNWAQNSSLTNAAWNAGD